MVQSIDMPFCCWFKHRIPAKFREAIKQKLEDQGSDEAAVRAGGDKSCAFDGSNRDAVSSFRTKQHL